MSFFQRLRRDLHWFWVVGTLRLIFCIKARVHVLRLGTIPPTGPFILATNHVSHFDPPLITVTLPRRIDWIADAALFHGRLLNAFFTGLHVIPVDRSGADRTALRTAVKRLKDDRVVGIFPEGGIRDGASSIVNGATMKQGVALLSGMAAAPVLPGVILGSDRLYNKRNWLPLRRPQVWIAYGTLIEPPAGLSGDALRSHMTQALAREIITLKNKLFAEFALTEDDLPQPPRKRMSEA